VYLINYLNALTIRQLFVAAARYRTGQELQGVVNGSNTTFRVPGGDKFTHNLPFMTIQVYLNGQRLRLLEDYGVSESGGYGSGYDTVQLAIAPRSQDALLADYIATDGS
jgi:hypothetical protein